MILVAGALAWGSLSSGRLAARAAEGFPYGDEGLHVAGYAALALVVTYAWLPAHPTPLVRGVVVFASVLAFGLAIEALQSQVPGRTPDLGDAMADALGAATAVVWDAVLARWIPPPVPDETGS